jgi:hypothetical protein
MANKNFKVKNGLDIQSPLDVSMGGTGQTSATNAINALLPDQSSAANKVLSSDGTNLSWVAQSVAYTRGGTESRPVSPTAGDLYYNTDNNYFESYTANGWFPIAAAPGIPTSVVATNQGSGRAYNNGRASVAFNVNANAGAPSSFIVTPTPTTSPSTFTGSSSPITVTGLASSTQYTYTVAATSPYGTSSASSASSGVTATTVPQAPTIGSATKGNAQAEVSFTAGNTGGSSITGYTVTSSPENITATGSSSPITVTGLTNGTAYTFTVTATNANGTSAASSASSSVTPENFVATSSYDALASVTLSTAASSITFTGIPSGYKHLEIRGIARGTRNGSYDRVDYRFNGDSGSNYSRHLILSDWGANTPSSYGYTGQNILAAAYVAGATSVANTFGGFVITVLDYDSTTKYKTTKAIGGATNNGSGSYFSVTSGAYMSLNPINSITIGPIEEGSNLAAYSSIALYGVK